jgi:hypothetical protein
VATTLTLQPARGARDHWTKVVPDSAVRAADDQLSVVWHVIVKRAERFGTERDVLASAPQIHSREPLSADSSPHEQPCRVHLPCRFPNQRYFRISSRNRVF